MINVQDIELQYVTNRAGEKSGVLLPIGQFEELLEDIDDLAAIAERREEPTVPHDEVLVQLRRDGLI